MRVLIVAGRWLAAVLGLSVLCIVLALGFFNPNARRGDIEAWVSEQTGRSFTLDGELGWQVWPSPAVTLPHIRLGAAPGTQKAGNALAPFAEWQQASVSIRLWPLIRGRLEFGPVQLRGLRLRLRREATGHNNWQDLLQLLSADRPPGRFKFGSLAGLQLDDAEITFDDATAQRMTALRIQSLHTTAVAFGQPTKITLKAQASTRTAADSRTPSDRAQSQSIELPFTLALQGQADELWQRWQLQDIQFAAQMTANGVLGDAMLQALPITLQLQQVVWQVEQPLVLDALQAAVGEAQLIANEVRLTQLDDMPRVAADLQMEVPNLRQWLQRLRIKLPATRDATVLQSVSAQLQAAGSVEDLRLQVRSLRLDQTRFSGAAGLQHLGATSRYTLDLHADQLDLDRYLPVAVPAAGKQRSSSPVPIDWLRTLHVQGRLHIDTARWQGVRAQQLTITLDGT